MIEPLTPEEARTIALPLNPIKRLGRLAELGAGYALQPDAGVFFPGFWTRGILVRVAEAHARALNASEVAETVS